MRFGVNTLIWSISFNHNLIPWEKLKAAGVDGIEAPVFAPSEFPVAQFRKYLSDYELAGTVCSICPGDGRPGSDDALERARALDHWKAAIRVAGEVGAEVLAGPSCAPVGDLPGRRRTEDEWKRVVEFHQELGPVLDDAGVDLAIEPINRFETYFLNTAADARRLTDEIDHPRVGILLDTFHSNIEDKSVAGAYRECGPRLRHVHTCENDRGIPGSGHVDWLEVIKTLHEMGYDQWLTIESFNAAAPELAAATAIWRDLAESNDDIAVCGVEFLRGLVGTL